MSKKKNGFLMVESLLALLICIISSFLLLTSISALSKSLQLDVHSSMPMQVSQEK